MIRCMSSVSMMDGLPITWFSSQDPIFASDHRYAENQIPPGSCTLIPLSHTRRMLKIAIQFHALQN